MNIYCIERFKTELKKLSSKKAYRSLEKDLINHFFNKSIKDLCSGTRLNNSDQTPYIKKRLNGSSGFRCYFLLIIKSESLYLMYVHPKTGPDGSSNITNESKSAIYKEVLLAIQSDDLYQLSLNDKKNKIQFNKL